MSIHINPIALRKAKIVYNFGLSECNRVIGIGTILEFLQHFIINTLEVYFCIPTVVCMVKDLMNFKVFYKPYQNTTIFCLIEY